MRQTPGSAGERVGVGETDGVKVEIGERVRDGVGEPVCDGDGLGAQQKRRGSYPCI